MRLLDVSKEVPNNMRLLGVDRDIPLEEIEEQAIRFLEHLFFNSVSREKVIEFIQMYHDDEEIMRTFIGLLMIYWYLYIPSAFCGERFECALRIFSKHKYKYFIPFLRIFMDVIGLSDLTPILAIYAYRMSGLLQYYNQVIFYFTGTSTRLQYRNNYISFAFNVFIDMAIKYNGHLGVKYILNKCIAESARRHSDDMIANMTRIFAALGHISRNS